MAILVGYDQGTVKKEGPNKGKMFKILHVVQDGGTNTIGQTVESIFTFDEVIINKINESYVGKKIDLMYNIASGRAYLRDVELLK